MIVKNFNHERFVITSQANRSARICLAEALRYATVRKTFGKKLIEHEVIRAKLAEIAMRVESIHSELERICYQEKCGLSISDQGGSIALMKVFASRTFEIAAREASQIFGGSSYVRTGKGHMVERLYREVRGAAIPGGSEEIMMDFAIRQSLKQALSKL